MEALLLTTASTPDRTCRYVRCRHARPSSGSDDACRAVHASSGFTCRHQLAWALGARGSWLVSSCGHASRNRASEGKTVRQPNEASGLTGQWRDTDCRVDAHTAHLPLRRAQKLRQAWSPPRCPAGLAGRLLRHRLPRRQLGSCSTQDLPARLVEVTPPT